MEDYRFPTRDVFTAMKESGELPFGQVPLLVVGDGDVKIPQSSAILRYICLLGGLAPADSVAAARVDAIVAAEGDAFAALGVVKYRARNGLGFLDDATAERALQEQRTDVVPRHLRHFEAILAASQSGWAAGTERPSAADFAWGTSLRDIAVGINAAVPAATLDALPKTKAFMAKFLALKQVEEYYAAFP
jgi:glutathione S-transferase